MDELIGHMLCHMSEWKHQIMKYSTCYLQKSLIHYEVSSGEVKRAVLTQLSIPVLTPWPVDRVQI